MKFGQSFKFIFVGDEHPLTDGCDLTSRGSNFILSQDMLKKNTVLILEFLCSDIGNQLEIADFLSPNSSWNSEKKLKRSLNGKNLMRGFKDCKNISFYALIRKSKEVGTKVICGDSSEALGKKNSFGATDDRHEALNHEIYSHIKEVAQFERDPLSFVILCGDSHLFDKANSPSLPKLTKDHFQGSSISVYVQENIDIVKIMNKYYESPGICYNYLPMNVPKIISQKNFGQSFSSEEISEIIDSHDSFEKLKKKEINFS